MVVTPLHGDHKELLACNIKLASLILLLFTFPVIKIVYCINLKPNNGEEEHYSCPWESWVIESQPHIINGSSYRDLEDQIKLYTKRREILISYFPSMEIKISIFIHIRLSYKKVPR